MFKHQFPELDQLFFECFALAQRYYHRFPSSHNPLTSLHQGQGRVLAILRLRENISTKELVDALGIRPQSLNELLHKLEKNGYITRTKSPADGRVMLINLTEKGKNIEVAPAPQTLTALFSEEESKYFTESFKKLRTKLREELQIAPDSADFSSAHHHHHGFGPHHHWSQVFQKQKK